MAFPTFTSAVSIETSNVTTHSWTLPSGNAAGKLLILIACFDGGSSTITPTPTGFTIVKNWPLGGSGGAQTIVYYKFTDGTETDGTYSTDVAEKSVNITVLFSGAHASTAPEGSTSANGSSSAANPDSLNPAGWGTEDTTWLAFVFTSENGDQSLWTAPSGYTKIQDGQSGNAGSDTQCALWYLDNNAASEDPGTSTLDGSRAWVAGTIAIRPAAAAVDPGIPPDVTVPAVMPRRAEGFYAKRLGSRGTELFQTMYTDVESVFADKFQSAFPDVMRKRAWRPDAQYAYTEVPVVPDVVAHGWEFANHLVQIAWRKRLSFLAGQFVVPTSQDPATLGYLTILGTMTIEPTRFGANEIVPSYEGPARLDSEGGS